jgi:hypothetical protein
MGGTSDPVATATRCQPRSRLDGRSAKWTSSYVEVSSVSCPPDPGPPVRWSFRGLLVATRRLISHIPLLGQQAPLSKPGRCDSSATSRMRTGRRSGCRRASRIREEILNVHAWDYGRAAHATKAQQNAQVRKR